MVYIHIPFCRTRCIYCGFYSELSSCKGGSDAVAGLSDSVSGRFVDALLAEIASSDPTAVTAGASTLYFGGGTPSLLSVNQLARIVAAVKEHCGNASFEEFTIEVNPDDIVKKGDEYVSGLRGVGVNRVSMGVQAFDDDTLHRMGRRHDWAEAREVYALLRRCGFDNISIDFIFGFNPASFYPDFTRYVRDGLNALPGGLPEHISCYQLSVEQGSGLEKMLGRGLFQLPCDEECSDQYYALCGLLRELGYEHYEISNWALPGHRSVHNSAYWHHIPYVGFGPGAHSLFVENGQFVRRWNEESVARYVDVFGGNGDAASLRGFEVLTPEQLADERLMLGLRTAEGVDGKKIPEDKWFVSDSIIVDMLR